MSNTIISPNMNLPVPVPTVDPGPDYANNEVQCFNQIDSHNHTPGNGVPITPAGLNVNSALDIQGNALNNVGPITFSAQSSVVTTATLYEKGVDLYYNDGSGNVIQITKNGFVTGAVGTITGLPSGTASASFQSVSGTFQFQSATNTAASMDVGPLVTRNTTVSSNAVTITAPTPLSSDYTMTLPNGTPATTSYVKSDSSGNLSYTDVNFILPAGMMMMYGGTSTPAGWLFCVGQVVSQTTYANLYSAIGSAFNTGGEGAGNFRLPDFRRKAPVGAGGTGSATLGNSVGNSGGAESVTLTTANLPSAATTTSAGSHIHSILTGWTGAGGGTRNFIANGVISNQPDAVYTSSYSGADLTQSAGTHTHTISGATDTSVNNIQPSLVVNYIIKY